MPFPFLLLGAGAVGAYYWLKSGRGDAITAKANMNKACDTVAALVYQAATKGITRADISASLTSVLNEQKAVNDLSETFSSDEVSRRAKANNDAAKALGVTVSGLIGVPNPVPGADSDWLQTALIAAAVAGGVYLGYRYVVKPMLASGHGETIPRSQLPRYAGGSRTL